MAASLQLERERREQVYWSESPEESPGSRSLHLLTYKMSEARVALEKLNAYAEHLAGARVVVELGGGQGVVACMLKEQLGARTVITSDIAVDAVASLPEWERVFEVRLEGGLACRSYELPFGDGSVDLVVVFAAAHHFGAHRRTMIEIARVLRPGGKALYLHEPACRRYLHDLAVRRVMAKRPVVDEDVLVYPEIAALARGAGLDCEVIHAPTTTFRAPVETLYYFVLQRAPVLQKLLPCTVDIMLTKAG